MKLSEERCTPCETGGNPLPEDEARELARDIPQWTLSPKQIEREFSFKDFREAMSFVNKVAELANRQDHHPDITVSYRKVRIVLSTHKVGGLSRNDFIMASKIDELGASS